MSPAYNITLKQERDTAVQYSDVLQNHTPETHIIWLTISPQYIQQKFKKKKEITCKFQDLKKQMEY